MSWPDDINNAKKPRYSAETGSKLLVNKHLDLENTRNELVKVSEQLDLVTRDRDEATNKLRDETSRLTAVEELLRQRTEELSQEKLSRANLESELEVASAKYKEVDKERKGIQQQFDDFVSRQDTSDQRTKITQLERQLRSLEAENAALSAVPERPSSRTSSIPVPKSKRPRSSSENRSPRLEEDLKTCRVELADTKEKLKKAEAKARLAEESSIRLENEKTAALRKAQVTKAELENSLQEAKEEIELLQLEIQSNSRKGASATDVDELSKAYAGAQEQLQAAIVDKTDLERRLARKTTQCETLQEKLDGCMFPTSEDDDLRQELASARDEASRAKRQLTALKREMEHLADRRDSLLRTRYELQDRDLKVQSLEEQLRRRESTAASSEAQEERTLRFFNERETAKDNLAKSEARSRYFESQLQFRQQELNHAQSQVKDLEQSLTKARSLNAQQQELYSEAIKSCTIAEKRAAEVERELLELRDEMANRSTTEEAAERNRQWALALERVGQLERALDGDEDRATTPTPRVPAAPLPPIAYFGDQADMDAVASLFVTLQRIREERDTLRGSVEFLSFELRAKENAVEQRLESQRASSLLLVRSAEEDVARLRWDLTACEARLLESHEESVKALEECSARLSKTQVMSASAFVALQRANLLKESEELRWMEDVARLQSMLEEERGEGEKVQGLLFDLEERNRTISDVNARYSEATRNLRETTRELRTLQEKLGDLEEDRSKLEVTLDERAALYRDLERDHSSQVMAYQRLEETHQILREELYEARMEADQLRSNHMNTLADESPDAQSTLQGHIEELDARIVRRNEQIGMQQNDIRRLDMNLKIAEHAAEEMRLELGELRAQNVSLEEDAATVRQERNLVEKELDVVRGELDALRGSVDTQEKLLQEAVDARQQEISTLVQVISTRCLEVRQATRNLEEARAEIEELRRFREQNPEADQSHTSPQSHIEELEKLKQTLSNLSVQHEQDSSLLGEYSRRIEGLEGSLEEATSRGDALAHQLRRSNQLAQEEVAARMKTLEEQIDTLSGEVEALEERLAEGQQAVQEVLKQNGDLENQVCDLEANATATSRAHKEKIEGLEENVQRLQDERDHAREAHGKHRDGLLQELESVRKELSAALEVTKEADELKARAHTLRAEGQALATQLSSVSAELQARTAENADLTRRLNSVVELKATMEHQEASLQVSQAARAQAELDLANVQASLDNLRNRMEEKNSALEECRQELVHASLQIKSLPELRLHINNLEAATTKMKRELHEAQQAASAAASTTIRDTDANVRVIQLETVLATVREENEELERVLTLKTKEIDDHDDRHIELLKERKKLVAKIDALTRKMRNMQRQLDAATGVVHVDSVPDFELGASGASSTEISTPLGRPTFRSLSTPEMPQVRARLSVDLRQNPLVMAPESSNRPRKSADSLPAMAMEYPTSTPKQLSSSAPPVPMTVTTPSSALNLMPTSSLHSQVVSTPLARTDSAPPVQTSSSRKRRLPDDFDPSPEEHLPAMPVLSTTPRLRKALRDGPIPRTGFTPSRSRKGSAAAPDRELANVAAAAVASLNLASVLKPDPFSAAAAAVSTPLSSKPRLIAPLKSTFAEELAVGLSKAKPVSDITNTPKINRPPSSSSHYSAVTTMKPDPVAPAPKRSWLSGAFRTGVLSATTATSQTTARVTSRRAARALAESPKLGSRVLPKRPYGEIKAFSRELS